MVTDDRVRFSHEPSREYEDEDGETQTAPPRIIGMKVGFSLTLLDHPEAVATQIEMTRKALEEYAETQGARINKPYLAWIVIEATEKEE